MRRLLLVGILLVLSLPLASGANCEAYNTPNIHAPTSFNLSESKEFRYDVDSTVIDNRTTFTYNFLNTTFPGFTMRNDGLIEFTPGEEDVGIHKALLIAYADNDCFDSQLARFRVYDKPEIEATPPPGEVETREGKGVRFRASVIDSDDDNHSYTWEFRNKEYHNDTFTFLPQYNESGTYQLTLTVEDSDGLKDEAKWKVLVDNVNRQPVLTNPLPSISTFTGQDINAFDLNNYFLDPDKDKLSFAYRQVSASQDTSLKLTDIQVRISDEGLVEVSAPNKTGYRFYEFIATDPGGKSASSNNVKFTALRGEDSQSDYCGDDFCSQAETCNTCPQDCGTCENTCEPDWQCNTWGPCQPGGIQTRNCTDLNECGINKNKPAEARECEYTPTCNDGIQNQGEKGIDCGGPCQPCGTCNDGIQNQGEQGIDCGGPCDKQCPTCHDNVKNGNETDVDCGGPCSGCGAGETCKTNFDCSSFKCENQTCQPATCDDNIQNQNEAGRDCGGPCQPCPSCFDGIKNQGEQGIDCGGPCQPCPTCNDGVQNQGETVTDCGGPCESCSALDYIINLEFKKAFLTFLAIVILIIIGTKAFLSSEIYYDITSGGFFSFLEKDQHRSKVMKWNKIVRPFRIKVSTMDDSGITEETIDKLIEARAEKEEVLGTLEDFFHGIFALSDNPGYTEIYKAIKTSKSPFLTKMLLANLLRKYWFMKNEEVVLSEEARRVKREALNILREVHPDL